MIARRSIRFRLTIWYAAILTIALSLFGVAIWVALRARLYTDADRAMADRAAQFEQYFRGESAEAKGDSLIDELGEFAQALPPHADIEIRGPHGFAFVHPKRNTTAGAVSRALEKQFDVAGESFTLRTSQDLTEVAHTLELLRTLLFAIIPAVILIACASGYWLSGRALAPVREVTAAAGSISIENLSNRLPVPETGDEIARLTIVLNTMLERLESAVRTLSQFVADASHEIRTPLSVIRTTAELALRRPRTTESYRASLEEIAAETERMTHLVEDLLALARSDTGSVEMPLDPVDLREIVGDVCAEVRRLAELRDLRVDAKLGSEAVTVAGNRAALHRLFLVLLDNAMKFSPAGGAVIVELRVRESQAIVAIEDFGSGIRAEDLPHIFKRFYRADRARSGGSGYGLGLSLAESIARIHGARIDVRTGQSTVFEVAFAFSQSSVSARMIPV